ncbi:MAG: SusC/RagA family TonB-linked outer membrane protein [Flavobacteriales bacterium]|nr:SusC/RagA family TonB-linked outer membrane protein [Flavobacteriales bacterium]MCB9168421.1 SusC/RagA family TonB-linked outer membrane protein [Flavobacteriales bacterium]
MGYRSAYELDDERSTSSCGRHHFLTILLTGILFLPGIAEGQVQVSGVVSDAATGEHLPGVTVLLEQEPTTGILGVASDVDGRFLLEIPGTGGDLRFSFIGYKDQVVHVSDSNATDLNVRLAADVARLDEVVVTGIATNVKRRNLANAVATLSSQDLVGTTSPQTFDGALSGKVIGATITSSSGAPGGGIAVKLRGVTTFYGSSQPLYVVDGVFMDNSSIVPGLNAVTDAQAGGNPVQDNMSNRIADLDPADIESVEVLKGATAAAIYGSRAAAGVVVITTKKGLGTGGTQLNVAQDIGMARAQHLLGVRDWDARKVEDIYGPSAVSLFNDAQAAGAIYDYENEVYGETGLLLGTRVSARGGNARTQFYLAGGYLNEDGIVKHTGYKRYDLRANVRHQVNDRIALGFTSYFVNSDADRGLTNNDNTGTTYGISLAFTPGFVELHPDAGGNYPDNPFASSNVLQTRDLVRNNESTYRTINGLDLKALLQRNGRSVTRLVGRGGFDFYSIHTIGYFPNSLQFESDGAGTNGASIQGRADNLDLNMYGALVNEFTFGRAGSLTSSLGATYESGRLDHVLVTATQLIGTQTNLDQASATSVTQEREAFRNNGFLVQEELDLNGRYLINAGLRLDRSTLAGDITKYFAYPKASVAWNIARMPFWTLPAIESCKLRVAYGQSGNLPPYYAKYTLFSSSNTGGQPGSLIDVTRGNTDIVPERQTELEGGLDLSYKGRLTAELTYYNKVCYDLLLLATVPPSSGYTFEYVNGGELANRGIEIGVGAIPVSGAHIRWQTRVAWWKNTSEVRQLSTPAFTPNGSFGNSLGTFYIEEGRSATQIVGVTGNVMADGTPEIGVLGDAAPDFQMSFWNELTIGRNLSLRFFIHWKQGGDNINLTEFLTDLGGTSSDFDEDADGNGLPDGVDRLNDPSAQHFVQDASYVRIREIGLYYTLPDKTHGGILKGARIGVSLNNYFTFTKYRGYDPEVSNFGINGINTGVDVAPYPSAKRAFLHISVDL